MQHFNQAAFPGDRFDVRNVLEVPTFQFGLPAGDLSLQCQYSSMCVVKRLRGLFIPATFTGESVQQSLHPRGCDWQRGNVNEPRRPSYGRYLDGRTDTVVWLTRRRR